MYVSKEKVLAELPPNREQWVIVSPDQGVSDIIDELVQEYPLNEKFYDRIGMLFKGQTLRETCDNLYDFCKRNLEYREEPESWQTHASPQGLLDRGYCDCKGYASFIGGCLGAIARATGEPIDWAYYFASYDPAQPVPYHVFVTVTGDGQEIWVDPTPGADGKMPVYEIIEKPGDGGASVAAVNPAGELVYENRIGAASGTNVPPSAIPLPTGYPAGIPQPYVVNGMIQLTPVPPNFSPTPEQIAWMMWALQAWVTVYGTWKYNVFEYRSHEDGTGGGIATWIQMFCERYMAPDAYTFWQHSVQLQLQTSNYYASGAVNYGSSQLSMQLTTQQRIQNFDFGNPPKPYTPSGFEKTITDIMDTVAVVVLQYASNLLPVIGPAYANAWLKSFVSDGQDAAILNQQVAQAAGGIAANYQAEADEVARRKQIGTYCLIGAALLALWWVYDTYE